eukprot:PhF_6_TR18952/c0_g1_i2/m.27797
MLEQEVKQCLSYYKARKGVREELMRPAYSVESIRSGDCILQALDQQDRLTAIANDVVTLSQIATSNDTERDQRGIRYIGTPPPTCVDDFITSCTPGTTRPEIALNDAIIAARAQWQCKVVESVLASSVALASPFMKSRISGGPSYPTSLLNAKMASCVAWTPSMLHSAITSIVSDSNTEGTSTSALQLSTLRFNLPTWTITELRTFYQDLSPKFRQTGVDEALKPGFAEERHRLCAVLGRRGFTPHLNTFLRRGSPAASRVKVWMSVLQCEPGPKERQHYTNVRADVWKVQCLMDDMARIDVLNAINDDRYFVFEDNMMTMLTTLIHDTMCINYTTDLPRILAKGPNGSMSISPSGVIPCQGLAFLSVPVCFVTSDPLQQYYLFRTLYLRRFQHLHTISTSPDGIVSLLTLFESLLILWCPQVVEHFRNTLHMNPTWYATLWLHTAFSGVFEVEQLLLLWDRIIAYDSNTLLSIVAAALFAWRADDLLLCQNESQVNLVFSDVSKVQVMLLIQSHLFID